MKLCYFFRCCLPVPEKDSDGNMASSNIKVDSNRKKKTAERAKPSGKKMRKEAKRLKKEMADRREREWIMIVSDAHRDLVRGVPRAEVMERMDMRRARLYNPQIIIDQASVYTSQDDQDASLVMSLANANSHEKEPQSVSCPTLEKDKREEDRRERLLTWFDRREAAKKISGTVCSVPKAESARPSWSDQTDSSEDNMEEDGRLQLRAWLRRRGVTSPKEAAESCTLLGSRGPQLAKGDGKSPSDLVTTGDLKGPVIRPRLDYHLTVCHGDQRRHLTPQKKDVLEEERRLQLLGWFERRDLTILKAANTEAAESCTENGSHEGHGNILAQ